MLPPSLASRRLQAELMDDPALEVDRHETALRALRTVNRLSGTVGRIWWKARSLGLGPGRPLRLLDLACGGGDVIVALARRAQRSGFPLTVDGCDRSPVALDHARRAAAAARVEARFFECDALTRPLPRGYDLICCSLFLHHLSRSEALRLLGGLAETGSSVLIQDLRRTRIGYLLALLTLHGLTRSDVARVDGVRSVEGAFTLREAGELAREAGVGAASVRRCWPQRYTLSWPAS